MATSYDDPPPGQDTAVLELGTSRQTRLLDAQAIAIVRRKNVPNLVAATGDDGVRRFLEFFTATIRNRNTRAAYAKACSQFLTWSEGRGVASLAAIEPMTVAAYIESHPGAVPTVKQHLAAIRAMFDWLVTGQIMRSNPAHSVRGPKHVVGRGKTPVLDAHQARVLLDSIALVNRDGTPPSLAFGTEP